jgi:hypothetical protein
MGVEQEQLDTVANKLHELWTYLDNLSYDFRDGDTEKTRLLAVVRECEGMLWGRDADRVPYRKKVGPAARVIEEKMQPLLHEACAMKCAHIWFVEPIHVISGLVDGICAWQAGAGARAAVREAEKAAVEAETKKASRPVEAFAGVTVVGGEATMLTEKRREALRKVVGEMRINLLTLKNDVKRFDKELVLFIEMVARYHESCCGDNTWIWDASAWEQAGLHLRSCVDGWKRESRGIGSGWHWLPRLKREGEQCVLDMAEYKRICSDPAGTSWGARMRKVVGLDAKLEALQACV